MLSYNMGKRTPPCSKRELYKNLEIRTSISMSYYQNHIAFLIKIFMRVWSGDGTKSFKASGRPTCFAANDEGLW